MDCRPVRHDISVRPSFACFRRTTTTTFRSLFVCRSLDRDSAAVRSPAGKCVLRCRLVAIARATRPNGINETLALFRPEALTDGHPGANGGDSTNTAHCINSTARDAILSFRRRLVRLCSFTRRVCLSAFGDIIIIYDLFFFIRNAFY